MDDELFVLARDLMNHLVPGEGITKCEYRIAKWFDSMRWKIGHDRYEKLRKLNPRQYADLWSVNLHTGIPFDTLVDRLPGNGD